MSKLKPILFINWAPSEREETRTDFFAVLAERLEQNPDFRPFVLNGRCNSFFLTDPETHDLVLRTVVGMVRDRREFGEEAMRMIADAVQDDVPKVTYRALRAVDNITRLRPDQAENTIRILSATSDHADGMIRLATHYCVASVIQTSPHLAKEVFPLIEAAIVDDDVQVRSLGYGNAGLVAERRPNTLERRLATIVARGVATETKSWVRERATLAMQEIGYRRPELLKETEPNSGFRRMLSTLKKNSNPFKP